MKKNAAARRTVLFAIVLLFFVQLFTLWMESVYRMSLTRLNMGVEMFSMLLLLLPLALLAVPERLERGALWLSFGIFLGGRLVAPLLSTPGATVVSGMGVAAFVVVLAYAMSARYGALRGEMAAAGALAVLMSSALRAWGSSVDISMEGATSLIGVALAAGAVYLLRGLPEAEAPTVAAGGHLRRILCMSGLFSCFALVCFVLSTPAVVSSWSGCNNTAGLACLAVSLGALLVGRILFDRPAWRWPVLGSIVFAFVLVAGILSQTPSLPLEVGAVSVVTPARPISHLFFYLMFLLAPTVVIVLEHLASAAAFGRPRNGVVAVTVGMGFLLGLTTLLIFTSTWGYSGAVSHFMRGRFYLPFLVACVAMTAAALLARQDALKPVAGPAGWIGYAGCAIGLLAIAGAVLRTAQPVAAQPEGRRLTIMTYNIQQGSDSYGNRAYREQLELIRKVNPDIVGLQESDTARPSGGNVDATRYFADGLDYYSYYGPNVPSGTFGTSILSRFPLKRPRTFFTFSEVDEIGTAVAEIDLGDGITLTVLNNHPAGPDAAMEAHMKAMLEEAQGALQNAGEGKALIAALGDFNSRPDETPYLMATALLKDTWPALYPNGIGAPHPMMIAMPAGRTRSREVRIEQDGQLNMTRRIDHIFVSPEVEVLADYFLPPPQSETDHPVHWTVVGW